ncbi:unnamed protein product [Brassicogethes aeneus]|uniref:Uncharacterized protein n=1 Tax=Brassicogethes aeneus TaxID=1431903 RepID=A0A9P0FBP7_BRAAE|nr:unnamed protein product [Brassicogethes aeneus]
MQKYIQLTKNIDNVLYKNSFGKQIFRNVSIKSKKNKKSSKEKNTCEDECTSRACAKKNTSFFGKLFGGNKKNMKDFSVQPDPVCRQEWAKKLETPDLNLSNFGGQAYKTCGESYVIQKDLTTGRSQKEPEDDILRKMETPADLKDVVDPLPNFESVEQRLLELSDHGLHPHYKKYMFMSRKPSNEDNYLEYKTKSGPINFEDLPEHFKISKQILERKNIYADLKRADPPRHLLAKVLEIRENAKPTLEIRKC